LSHIYQEYFSSDNYYPHRGGILSRENCQGDQGDRISINNRYQRFLRARASGQFRDFDGISIKDQLIIVTDTRRLQLTVA
jgi:hypothetical protein